MSDPLISNYDHDEAHKLADDLMTALTPASSGMTVATVLYATVILQAAWQRINAEVGMPKSMMQEIMVRATSCGLQGFFMDHGMEAVVADLREQKSATHAEHAITSAIADVRKGWTPPPQT